MVEAYNPCANEFSAWKAAYAAWKTKHGAAWEGIEDFAKVAAMAVIACGTVHKTGWLGAAGCALALWGAWDKWWDAKKLVDEVNAAIAPSTAAGNAYRACINKHKVAQANAQDLGETEAIKEPDSGDIPDEP